MANSLFKCYKLKAVGNVMFMAMGRWSEHAKLIAQSLSTLISGVTNMWSSITCGRQLGNVLTSHCGSHRRVERTRNRISGESCAQFKSPMRITCCRSRMISAIKATCFMRALRLSARCMTHKCIASPLSPPNRARRAPLPGMPGKS